MNHELQNLLLRWREGSITTEEMRALTVQLAKPEAREALRRDWFLDAALPQALAASEVIARAPRPVLARRMRSWIGQWFMIFTPSGASGEETSLFALRLWARASSLAALGIGLIAASWLFWPREKDNAAHAEAFSEPAYLAQLMIETHLSDSR